MPCLSSSLPSRGDILYSCCSHHRLRPSSVGITWEFVRKADSQALPKILNQNPRLTSSQEIPAHTLKLEEYGSKNYWLLLLLLLLLSRPLKPQELPLLHHAGVIYMHCCVEFHSLNNIATWKLSSLSYSLRLRDFKELA